MWRERPRIPSKESYESVQWSVLDAGAVFIKKTQGLDHWGSMIDPHSRVTPFDCPALKAGGFFRKPAVLRCDLGVWGLQGPLSSVVSKVNLGPEGRTFAPTAQDTPHISSLSCWAFRAPTALDWCMKANHRLWNKKGRDVSYVSSWSTSDMAVTTAHLKGDMSEERPGDRNITASASELERQVPACQLKLGDLEVTVGGELSLEA